MLNLQIWPSISDNLFDHFPLYYQKKIYGDKFSDILFTSTILFSALKKMFLFESVFLTFIALFLLAHKLMQFLILFQCAFILTIIFFNFYNFIMLFFELWNTSDLNFSSSLYWYFIRFLIVFINAIILNILL